MKRITILLNFLILALFAADAAAQSCQAPVITNFSPITGYIGSTVTISGSDFDPVAANNQVFFGATQATVLTANSFGLTVKVPVGSTYAPITVKNACGKVAQSRLPFNAIFCNAVLRDTSYNEVSYSQSVSGGYQMLSQDIDLDGKPDLLVTGFTTNAISIVRNLSTPGTISFATPIALGTPSNTRCIAPGDFDGDGKIDLAVTVNGYGIYVFKNNSTPGTISFGSPLGLPGSTIGTTGTYQMWAGDLNGDGKLDLVYSDFSGTVRTLLNTSTTSISFSPNTSINNTYGTTGISLGDIDGDGKTDIVTSCPNNNLMTVIRNTTTTGSSTFSFGAITVHNTGSNYPYRAFVGDFDKDGKLDLITNNHNGPTVSIFRNTSTSGSVSMAAPLNLSSPSANYRVAIGDADGDGLPDIVTKSSGENKFSVYKNISTGAGSIAFNTRIDYVGQAEVSGIAIGDLDGDYVPDIATSGTSYNNLRIYRNRSSSVDTEAPTAICRNIVVYLDSTGNASISPNDIDNGSSDACGIQSITLSKNNFNCSNLGNNTVTLTVTDRSNNTSTCTANVEVKAIQPSGITTLCAGGSVVLSAVAGTSYIWSTSETTRSITVNSSGTYTVSVIGSSGCNDTITSSVSVTVITSPTVYQVSGGGVYCSDGSAGLPITLSGSQTGIIYRLKHNGAYILNIVGTGSSINFGNFTDAGIYKVDATVLSNECPNTVSMADSAVIKVSTIPKVNISQSATQICSGASASLFTSRVSEKVYYIPVSQLLNTPNDCGSGSRYNCSGEPGFQWQDNGVGAAQNVKIEFSIGVECHSGFTHTAKLNGNAFGSFSQTSSWCSCSGNSNLVTVINANPSNYNVGGTNSFVIGNVNTCLGFFPSSSYNNNYAKVTVTYGSNTNGLSLLWTPGNQTADSIIVSPTTTSSYILAVSDSVGCTGYDTATIQVNPNPTVTVSLSGAPIVANGSTVTLTASTNDTYEWNTSETTQSITVNTAGTYNVTVYNSFGCSAVSQDVTILNCTYPEITCPSDVLAYSGTSNCNAIANYNATATGLPAPSLSYSIASGSTFNVGITSVQVIASNACGEDTCNFNVEVKDNIAPNTVCKNITVELDSSGNASISAADVDNGSSDACGIASRSLSKTSFNCNDVNAGYSLGFNNGSDGVTSNNTASIPTGSAARTFTAWVYPTASNNDWGIVHQGNYDCTGLMFGLGLQAGNRVTYWGGCNDFVSTMVAPTNQWSFIAVTYNGANTYTVYLNGSSQSATLGASNTPASKLFVGHETTDNGSYFRNQYEGRIDEVQIYDRVLTASELASVMNGGNPAASNRKLYYAFNEGSGTSITDLAGSNNATLVNPTGNNWVDPSPVNAGQTVTLTVTDNNNNASSCNANVTVLDNIKPTAICRNITVQLNNNGTATITAADINNGSSDACGIKSLVIDKSTFNCSNVGANTVTLTVTDNNNNVSTCQSTVTVEDKVAPVLKSTHHIINGSYPTSPLFMIENVNECESTAASFNPVSLESQVASAFEDACGGQITAIYSHTYPQNSPTNSNCNWLFTYFYKVKDQYGNFYNNNIEVVRYGKDETKPTASCKPITIALVNGAASISASDINNNSYDNCSSVSLSVSKSTFNCSNVGDNTVTLTVTDTCGNFSTCDAVVTVVDNTPPNAVCKNITVRLDNNGSATISESDVNDGSNDICGIKSMTIDKSTFNCNNVGANTVTLTVTDNNNNVSTCQSTVTVVDTVAPNALCKNVTLQLDAAGKGTILSGASSTTIFTENFSADGTTRRNVTSSSSLTNWTILYGDLDVGDWISQLSGSEIDLGGWVNSAIESKQSFTLTPGNYEFSLRHIRNSYDQSFTVFIGNVASHTFNSTSTAKLENFNFTLTSTSSVKIKLVQGGPSDPAGSFIDDIKLVKLNPGTLAIENGSTDACGIASITASKTDFDCSNVGANTVILTVTDVNNNVSTCQSIVTVVDNVAPTAICKNITVQLDNNGTVTISAGDVNDGSNDACGIKSMTINQSSFDCNHVGPNTVTLTVTDNNNNVSTCQSTVTVEDNVSPTAICQNITVQLDNNGTASITASDANNGSNDACGIKSLSIDKSTFDCSNVGANTVTLTVTDNNNNVSTCQATVTVEDNVSPTAICQNITVQLDNSGAASITAGDIDNGSNDACGIKSLSIDKSTFDCSNVGANTVTLTVTDNNNNVSTCQATVTVEDNVAPNAVAQNVTVTLSGGAASVTAAQVDNGSSDACGIQSMSVSPSSFDCSNIGANTVTLTVTDNNNNVSTTTATVTVVGTIPTVSVSQGVQPEFCQGGAVVMTATSNENVSYAWSNSSTTAQSNAYASGTYSVTVTNQYGCTATASTTVAYSQTDLLSAYTILAEDEVKLHQETKVNSGGVGSIGTSPKKSEIEVKDDSYITASGTFARATKVEIKNGSSITNVYSGSPAGVAFPTFMENPYCDWKKCGHKHCDHNGCKKSGCKHENCNKGKYDVKVKKNTTVTLGDSIFRKIHIESGATVIFTSANIYADEIETQKDVTIQFSSCAKVYLCDELKIHENNTFNDEALSVVIYAEKKVDIKKGTELTASIYTRGHLDTKGDKKERNTLTGMFIAEQVHAHYTDFNSSNVCGSCSSSNKREYSENKAGLRTEDYINVYPNPTSSATTVAINANAEGKLKVSLMNLNGQLVRSTQQDDFSGMAEVSVDMTDCAEGMYFIKVEYGDKVQVFKVHKVH